MSLTWAWSSCIASGESWVGSDDGGGLGFAEDFLVVEVEDVAVEGVEVEMVVAVLRFFLGGSVRSVVSRFLDF